MIEVPFIFFAGFLGSGHCVGMCGPFAILIGSTREGAVTVWSRQLIYSGGRIATYVAMGIGAGFGGIRLSEVAMPSLINTQAALSLAAGLFLVWQGLSSLGAFRRLYPSTTTTPCLAGGILAGLLRSSRIMDVFLAGVFTGFMPCGLVYGMLGLAASHQNIALAGGTMLVFGLGTIPVMVATGIGGSLLSLAGRQRLIKIASICLLVAGAMSIARGAAYMQPTAAEAPADHCPLCP